jgi:hypothetical protein
MPDFIPDDEDEFFNYATTKFVPYATANATALGIAAATITALGAATTAFDYAWTAHLNAQVAAVGATTDKNTKMDALKTLIRGAAATVQANPAVTDTQKELLGVTIRKKTRSAAEVPTTIPIIQRIDTSTRAILRLNFVDSATPDTRAKPAGVRACEIREQIGGTAPTDPEDMAFLALESRTPYRADFDADDIGKIAYFAARWINTRNQPGPWSQIYSAIIPS